MLKQALDIAIVTRMTSKSFNITGTETLGMSPVNDEHSPYYGRIPIPPVLDSQLDNLWMQKMKPIQRKVLSDLNKMICGSDKKKGWLDIFLTIMILLSNLEFLYQKQHDQMRRYFGDVSMIRYTVLGLS